MICPNCKSKQTCVVNSREKTYGVYRRRECFDCGKRFSTKEIDDVVLRQYAINEVCETYRKTLINSILKVVGENGGDDNEKKKPMRRL